MSSPASPPDVRQRLRALPSVERLAQALARSLAADAAPARHTPAERRAAAREAIARLRAELRQQPATEATPADLLARGLDLARQRLAAQPGLIPVINATGVILHTNLGRAPLAKAALDALLAVGQGYSNLEYDLSAGERSRRDRHGEAHWQALLGCEAALVVNNCAAAVWLVLDTLARGQTALISRGELVEIGGGFRIPDIMAKSGVRLCEVGTTNRTRLSDYEAALANTPDVRLIVRVHPSNFRLLGFTERPSLTELAALARRHNLLLFEDVGSGLLADLAGCGLDDEPSPARSLAEGTDVVTFSADKLLGGPQAGIIAGRQALIARIRQNPLLRVLRADKLTYAALEATLRLYRTGQTDAIPVLAMIRQSPADLDRRARRLARSIRRQIPPASATVTLEAGQSVIGGGCAPHVQLPTTLICLSPRHLAAEELAARLRCGTPPIVARIVRNNVVGDPRTVLPAQERDLVAGIVRSLA
ncbi:L-seryl-tRNA(Sec) selenium transferase [Chloracidobacterium sp. D]|uniref:L-seryl-tRNA(Sec) selenium transferase n=1 Tax=Chloracidobacterium sp. D TaxID=2821536 RepID=UPI001B8C8206|nr:L-seryl-tRNA(Sec) selenium transferase [Chloracidobacterium sp. D]QUV81891.1 L-seryl-tRNA(Sec) selenium transferase [Chloracidobacterium sp. D]